jgi:hypothetical protein
VQPEEKAVWDQNDGYSEVMCVGKKPQFSLERMWWLWVWEGFSKHRGDRERQCHRVPQFLCCSPDSQDPSMWLCLNMGSLKR